MTESVITDWSGEKSESFGRRPLQFSHALHERPMFDDAGLAEVLDRYPRDKLGIFTMGEDPVAWRSWRRGVGENLSGAELLEAAREGRIWLNLRSCNAHLEAYAALSDEIFGDIERHVRGLKTFKRDVGLLISSPNAQVFYHLDVALVTLWQLRGRKRMWMYPVAEPYVGQEELEKIVLRETAEQFTFDPAWDEGADSLELEPGMMVTWPQNAPHRLVNGPMLNVSLSIEFMTPAALMRANVIYANGLLRKRLGARPSLPARLGPGALPKLAVARAAKALKLHRPAATTTPVQFRLERGGAIHPL